jgi:transposase InsO family protein
MYNHILKTRNMNKEAKIRARALSHWYKYGIHSAMDAFQVPKSTLYRWKLRLDKAHGHLESLNNKNRAPHRTRRRIAPDGLEDEIMRLRTMQPRMGKTQIYHTVKKYIQTSESTVGRVISDMKRRNLLPIRGCRPYKKKSHITRERRPEKVGIEADTVVRHVNGIKWYFVTAIDLKTRRTWVHLTNKHSSIQASNVMRLIDIDIQCVQTDNGSEFLNNFHQHCITKNIDHFFIYPNTPKMNAHIERFNRTLEEEFIIWHRQLMVDSDNLLKLNEKLQEYVSYYNTIRPHTSLGFIPPMEYYMNTRG